LDTDQADGTGYSPAIGAQIFISLKAGWLNICFDTPNNLDQEPTINAMPDQDCPKSFWQVFSSSKACFPQLKELALFLRRASWIVGDIIYGTTKVVER
jgi:hypothetical protein